MKVRSVRLAVRSAIPAHKKNCNFRDLGRFARIGSAPDLQCSPCSKCSKSLFFLSNFRLSNPKKSKNWLWNVKFWVASISWILSISSAPKTKIPVWAIWAQKKSILSACLQKKVIFKHFDHFERFERLELFLSDLSELIRANWPSKHRNKCHHQVSWARRVRQRNADFPPQNLLE